jgi:hypothetical protein
MNLKKAEPAIGDALRRTLRASDADRHSIHVSESCGWIAYTDRAQLWRKDPPGRLPLNAGEARAHAEHFLRELAVALNDPSMRRRASTLNGINLIPPLEHRETVVVGSNHGAGWDHWLYRAQPSLPLDQDQRRAALFGSQFEVRIGDGGRVVGYNARYRPITSEHLLAEVRSFAPADAHTHADGENQRSGRPERIAVPPMVYLQEGDGIPQHYVAPYYLVDNGHVLALASATPWSLLVSLEFKQLEDRTRATAVVTGGSGDYAFDWGIYEIDAMENGHRGLGRGSLVSAVT